MRYLPVFNFDDGAKPIVVLYASRKDRPMDFVFDDDGMTLVGLGGISLSAD